MYRYNSGYCRVHDTRACFSYTFFFFYRMADAKCIMLSHDYYSDRRRQKPDNRRIIRGYPQSPPPSSTDRNTKTDIITPLN